MLSLEVVLEVRRLLHANELSQRKIALKLGVSRGIVNAIANGQRGLHGRETTAIYSCNDQDQIAQRCQGCGAMVYMPCLLCQARRYRMRLEQDAKQHPGQVSPPQSQVA